MKGVAEKDPTQPTRAEGARKKKSTRPTRAKGARKKLRVDRLGAENRAGSNPWFYVFFRNFVHFNNFLNKLSTNFEFEQNFDAWSRKLYELINDQTRHTRNLVYFVLIGKKIPV